MSLINLLGRALVRLLAARLLRWLIPKALALVRRWVRCCQAGFRRWVRLAVEWRTSGGR